MKLKALLLPVVLFCAGLAISCAGEGDAAPDDQGESLPPLPGADSVATPPDATLYLPGGESIGAGKGSSCWFDAELGGACVDMIGIITNAEAVRVAAGSELRIDNGIVGTDITEGSVDAIPASEDPMPVNGGQVAYTFPEFDFTALDSELTDEGIVFTVDLGPGLWVLSVSMSGEPGSASYGVLVEVQ